MRLTRGFLMIVGLLGLVGSPIMSEPAEEEILSKLVVSYEDQGILTRDGQRKVVVYCKNESDYHISTVLDIDFFAEDGKQLTSFWDDQRITDLEPRAKTWGILWLKSIAPIASSKYHFSNVSYKKVEMPSGSEIIINIPDLAKMSQEQIVDLLGTPEKYKDADPNYITLVFHVNRHGLKNIEVSYYGPQLTQFIAQFNLPIKGYRLALEKLGLTSSILPDVTAPAVYRWEEHTRLNGFYSVQALRESGDKIESVSVVLHPPE